MTTTGTITNRTQLLHMVNDIPTLITFYYPIVWANHCCRIRKTQSLSHWKFFCELNTANEPYCTISTGAAATQIYQSLAWSRLVEEGSTPLVKAQYYSYYLRSVTKPKWLMQSHYLGISFTLSLLVLIATPQLEVFKLESNSL